MELLYVCNGEVESCKKSNCMFNGNGECMHTTDISYSRYDPPRKWDVVDGVYIEKVRDMKEKSCSTCMHKSAESIDPSITEGENRIVDCDVNELQMYSPWVDDCKHWEEAVDEG